MHIFLSSEGHLLTTFLWKEEEQFSRRFYYQWFFCIKAFKVQFFLFSSIVYYISFAEFFNFPCLFDFHFLKTSLKVAVSWSLHNSIMEFFSHERGFICTNVFFCDRCMFIEDAKDWLLNLSQDGHFRNCSWMGSWGQKGAPSLSLSHISYNYETWQLNLT